MALIHTQLKICAQAGYAFQPPSAALPDGTKITSRLSYLSTKGEAEQLSASPEEIVVI